MTAIFLLLCYRGDIAAVSLLALVPGVTTQFGSPNSGIRILKNLATALTLSSLLISSQGILAQENQASSSATWLAGDHHIHSRYSTGYNEDTDPPTPILGGDSPYPIAMNALMARHFGLSWTVSTDHGGPQHHKVSLEQTYPALLQSRRVLPDLVQFFGMELNTPGADHSSMIIPFSSDEARYLSQLEESFDRNNPWPADPSRDNEALMLEALKLMSEFEHKPVVIANHPSRSASGLREYGRYDPAELRGWNDTAPDVAVGMAGAPGHQAATLTARNLPRGFYREYPTLGGFDQLTAIVGGFWDSMLGEGRRWWITANSDSHVHYTEGGVDFWPGEYSKTYVYAQKNHDSILEGIRNGRVFVTTGDLISELNLTLRSGNDSAAIGGELRLPVGGALQLEIEVRDPAGNNAGGFDPELARIDVIVGAVRGPVSEKSQDQNDSARVVSRLRPEHWSRDGEIIRANIELNVTESSYVRIRGTSTNELEPELDDTVESPWDDLWFYANPIFITVD